MIAEDDDRPILMQPKLDVPDFWSIIKPELAGVHGLHAGKSRSWTSHRCTGAGRFRPGCFGMEGIVFLVGVPRTDAGRRGLRSRADGMPCRWVASWWPTVV